MALDILSCILGGGSLVTLIIFLVKRHDEKAEKGDKVLSEITAMKNQFLKLERDTVRTQLLLLMATYEDDDSEILTCAEHYFKKKKDGGLEGDWYLTSLFSKFCKKHNIEIPQWFKGE